MLSISVKSHHILCLSKTSQILKARLKCWTLPSVIEMMKKYNSLIKFFCERFSCVTWTIIHYYDITISRVKNNLKCLKKMFSLIIRRYNKDFFSTDMFFWALFYSHRTYKSSNTLFRIVVLHKKKKNKVCEKYNSKINNNISTSGYTKKISKCCKYVRKKSKYQKPNPSTQKNKNVKNTQTLLTSNIKSEEEK